MPQQAAFSQGVSALQVPVGRARLNIGGNRSGGGVLLSGDGIVRTVLKESQKSINCKKKDFMMMGTAKALDHEG